MWLEIFLFRRNLVRVHYFYIYAKQRSKWNSGKINYSYLLNKIMVSHTSTMHDHCIYECIRVWCVFELVRTSLLIANILRDLWDAIFRLLIGLEIQFGQLLFNCLSSGFPNASAYATFMCQILACCSGVLSLHLSRRKLESWDTSTMLF